MPFDIPEPSECVVFLAAVKTKPVIRVVLAFPRATNMMHFGLSPQKMGKGK